MSEMTATRMARGATYLAAAALWVWAAAALWQSVPAASGPRLDADAVFGAALVRRTASYQHFLRIDWLLLVTAQLAALGAVAVRARRWRLCLGRAGAGLVLGAVAVTSAW